MPYIPDADKALVERHGASTPGELNYALTMVCQDYIERFGERYSIFNDVVGALESCKQEFYRRVVAPYENEKCEANGDVY